MESGQALTPEQLKELAVFLTKEAAHYMSDEMGFRAALIRFIQALSAFKSVNNPHPETLFFIWLCIGKMKAQLTHNRMEALVLYELAFRLAQRLPPVERTGEILYEIARWVTISEANLGDPDDGFCEAWYYMDKAARVYQLARVPEKVKSIEQDLEKLRKIAIQNKKTPTRLVASDKTYEFEIMVYGQHMETVSVNPSGEIQWQRAEDFKQAVVLALEGWDIRWVSG
ncbi:MAG: hypothetical protein ABI690_27580 [Chloroflexota bacterium]